MRSEASSPEPFLTVPMPVMWLASTAEDISGAGDGGRGELEHVGDRVDDGADDTALDVEDDDDGEGVVLGWRSRASCAGRRWGR